MQIDLTQMVTKDLTLREGLIISLNRGFPVREARVLEEIADLQKHIIESTPKYNESFTISAIEFKYCVNAIKLSDYPAKTKFALLGGLSDHTN